MKDSEKNNCLALRYQFRDETGDYNGEHQDIRHQKWVEYVDGSSLTQNEKAICIKEFLENEKDSLERFRKKRQRKIQRKLLEDY